MQYLLKFFVVTVFLLVASCNKNETNNSEELNTITIGNYKFDFPTEFKLIERQGIDSYVGNVNGTSMFFAFDFGWYTSPAINLPVDEFEVIEDVMDGHFRQIVIPIDTELNYTSIHLYKLSDAAEYPFGFNSLTLQTSNITVEDQLIALAIFNSVRLIE